MCGNLGKPVQGFLNDRLITMRISGHLFSTMNVENGVPQVSVLSVTLFLFIINEIISIVRFLLSCRLFADDLNILVPVNNTAKAYRILQMTINKINN